MEQQTTAIKGLSSDWIRQDWTMIKDTAATDVSINPQPARRKKRLGMLAITAAVIVAGGMLVPGMAMWLNSEITVSSDRLRIASVVRGDFIRDLGVEGRVIAAVSPTLYSTAAGTVSIEVQPGDVVESGAILAHLDSPEVNAEYQQELAGLSRLQSELERQKIQVKKAVAENQQTLDLANVTLKAAEREMKRSELSYKVHSISEADYEKAGDDLARAKVEYRHAEQNAALEKESLEFEVRTRELEYERQQLLVDNHKRRVSELTIRSPVAGVVGSIDIENKAAVAPNQALITVVDLTALEVEVEIPQSYADDLGIGMNTEISYGGQRYAGALSALSPQVVNNQVIGRVRFTGDPPEGLRQSQRVQARIIIDELSNVLKLRRGSFTDAAGGRVAYVVENQDLARRVPIRLGARSISEIQIIEGLNEGQQVIISGIADFGSAETVRIAN
jgi:HlyD family secretion protein